MRDLVRHMRTTAALPGSVSEALQGVEDPRKGKPLDDKAISTEVAALFFAGVDTTAHTTTWILYASYCPHFPWSGPTSSSLY